MTIQVDHTGDGAGVKGRAGGVVAQEVDRLAAGGLRLERLVHRVVGVFADLGEVCLRYAVSAVAFLRSSRAFDQIVARVTAERAAGDLDGCLILAGNGRTIIIAFCTERTVDRTTGDRDLRQLAFCAVIADSLNVAVDDAAADRKIGV